MTTRCCTTLVFSLLLPLGSAAATHKCVVNGRTTYQQQPCAVSADDAAASAAAGARDDAARRKALADTRLVPMLREAFDELRGGRLDGYLARLCQRARQDWERPARRRVLEAGAADYARRKVELGRVLERDAHQVSFAASEVEPGNVVRAQRLRVTARFDWEADAPCLTELQAARNPD